MGKRVRTSYPGVYYREAARIGRKGIEKVYYIVFKKDGKVYEEKVGRQYVDAMTPARAARIRAERIEGKRLSRKEIRERKRAQQQAGDSRWTFDRLWEEYKRQKTDYKGERQDQSRYQNYLKSAFGDTEPRDLVPLDVDRLRLTILKGKSPQTVKHTLGLLRRIANFGAMRRLVDSIPFAIEMPKVHNQKTEDLTAEELNRLLKAIRDDSNVQAGKLMKMVLFTGMRRSELFRLKWEDMDFERGFISIIDPKGGPDQRIPLNKGAREILTSCDRTGSSYVFPGRNGRQRTGIKRAFRRIKAEAGLPKDFRPLHGLRHVYASMLASSGKVELYTLQKLLTHKSPVMTQRYAHLRDEALKRASEVATELIGEAINSHRRQSGQ